MKYGLKPALSIIAASVDDIPTITHDGSTTQVMHRWMGEHYIHEIHKDTGSGYPIEYTEKDIRRAVAYLRTINLIGAGLGREAARMRERVRDIASWHTNGWVVVTNGTAWWTDDTDVIWLAIDEGHTFLLVPCYVKLLN